MLGLDSAGKTSEYSVVFHTTYENHFYLKTTISTNCPLSLCLVSDSL